MGICSHIVVKPIQDTFPCVCDGIALYKWHLRKMNSSRNTDSGNFLFDDQILLGEECETIENWALQLLYS